MTLKTKENEDRFKQIQKECKREVRKAKRRFEKMIAESGNKKPFNSYIKSKTKTKVAVGPL